MCLNRNKITEAYLPSISISASPNKHTHKQLANVTTYIKLHSGRQAVCRGESAERIVPLPLEPIAENTLAYIGTKSPLCGLTWIRDVLTHYPICLLTVCNIIKFQLRGVCKSCGNRALSSPAIIVYDSIKKVKRVRIIRI